MGLMGRCHLWSLKTTQMTKSRQTVNTRLDLKVVIFITCGEVSQISASIVFMELSYIIIATYSLGF